MLDLFAKYIIPLDDWTQAVVEWMTINCRSFFQAIRWPVARRLAGVDGSLVGALSPVALSLAFQLAWCRNNRKTSLGTRGWPGSSSAFTRVPKGNQC